MTKLSGLTEVEDLEHRILAEAAAKEELKCSAEVLAQSLNLALLRLKDACRAEPAGDWLQRQVWQFCDDVQEQLRRPSPHSAAARSHEALAASLSTVRRRKGALKAEMARQNERHQAILKARDEAQAQEQELQARLQRQSGEISRLEQSRFQSDGAVEEVAVQLKREQASHLQELERAHEATLSRAREEHQLEKGRLLRRLAGSGAALRALQKEAAGLRQVHSTAMAQMNAELARWKEGSRTVGRDLLEAVARCQQSASRGARAAEERLQTLRGRLVAQREAALGSLEAWRQKGLALGAEAEQLASAAAEETARLTRELSVAEAQRSEARRSPRSSAGALAAGALAPAAACTVAALGAEEARAQADALEARVRALVDERVALEDQSGAERLGETQQELQRALAENERLRQQMEDVRLEANEAFRAVEAEDRPEADVEELEQRLSGLELQHVQLKAELVVLQSRVEGEATDRAKLERDRALWRAQTELARKLHLEVEQAAQQAKTAWVQECDQLKEQLASARAKEQRLRDAQHAQVKNVEPRDLRDPRDPRVVGQLQAELKEVQRCLGTVAAALSRQSAAKAAACTQLHKVGSVEAWTRMSSARPKPRRRRRGGRRRPWRRSCESSSACGRRATQTLGYAAFGKAWGWIACTVQS
ncbi:unnamed protein product [Effrenium voratum]|uniref:Uncharacterized protein n=1 Tax=Effrenium voratum TaxID=2562239 RepID=A0AA36HTV3_9DINO|nr:unnamed protein product [Effrenium voratum]